MAESRREKWAGWLGLFVTVVPAMITSGFMPQWDVLPFLGWLGVATVGAAVSGAIATPRWGRGAVAGALVGAGILFGTWAYVALRGSLTGHHTFLKIELAIGALLGAAPGIALYTKWARIPVS